ncbi:MAG: hypothetical protein KJ561_03205, partial [Nanoarchaeota archaeon]|nr:hypothetical protein [Nanoarchaeota archaeon]
VIVTSRREGRMTQGRFEGQVFMELTACKRFCRHYDLPIKYFRNTNDLPKELICKRLHARAIVDDTLKKLEELKATGLMLLFLRQPWNVNEKISPLDRARIIEIGRWTDFYRKMIQLKTLHEAICYFEGITNNWFNLSKINHIIKEDPKKCRDYYKNYLKMEK